MYSFQPLLAAAPDYGAVFVGGSLLALLICFVSILSGVSGIIPVKTNIIGSIVVWAILTTGIYYSAVASVDITQPKNEKVEAEFKGYMPEGYRELSGKTKVDRHYLYVIYAVNGNDVILRATPGLIYPKRAILYKN